MRPRPSQYVRHLDIPALREVAEALTAEGHSQDEVIDEVVALVDALIDWSVIGPVGVAIDAFDGPVARAVVRLLLRFGRKKG